MADQQFHVTIVTPRTGWLLPSVEVIEVLSKWARYVPYRWVQTKARTNMEREFLSFMGRVRSQRSAAYLWPDATTETIRELKRRNVIVIREQFNCHTGTAKRILDQAYERLGMTPQHRITAETVDREVQLLEEVDYIFCPSPEVQASLLENGVPSSRLLGATYGWEPSRFSELDRPFSASEGITAVFVGAICVRKGAHLLLDYWARSNIKGRLLLVGEMDPIIKEKCAGLLARDDVVVFDYHNNVGALYRSADIFVFPSLEEGSPLVIYEACACGLPIVTTDMAAGWIVRHNCEGFVIDPYNAIEWLVAIRTLAEDAKLRRRMANAAAERAQSFQWTEVARKRRRQILDCFGKVSSSAGS